MTTLTQTGMEDGAMPKRRPMLWIDTRGEPVVTHSANGEKNALRWGWVRATAVPMLDPEPWVWSGTKGEAISFAPRPGYSQNREDYES